MDWNNIVRAWMNRSRSGAGPADVFAGRETPRPDRRDSMHHPGDAHDAVRCRTPIMQSRNTNSEILPSGDHPWIELIVIGCNAWNERWMPNGIQFINCTISYVGMVSIERRTLSLSRTFGVLHRPEGIADLSGASRHRTASGAARSRAMTSTRLPTSSSHRSGPISGGCRRGFTVAGDDPAPCVRRAGLRRNPPERSLPRARVPVRSPYRVSPLR